jgi:L-aminopeptidase/D-esterase-like protein
MLTGLRIGHAHCARTRTGVTVIVPDAPVVMACDVRGGGPGTRETDALEPTTLVERVHALVLSGGSVFGLQAADAVALALARSGRGLAMGEGADTLFVPVVPAAILFDLANGGDKGFARAGGEDPPYARLALAALAAFSDVPAEGRVGAGYGAQAGSRQGGIGIAAATLEGGGRVAALVAVNSFGEVYADALPSGPVPMPKRRRVSGLAASTCIGCIATDVPLTRASARRLAMMAHDGLARSIRPIHTPFDGDALFALSTSAETPVRVEPFLLAELGTRAADCVANAVRRAVFDAQVAPG